MARNRNKLKDTLTVYYDKEKTCSQTIHPDMQKFNGSWGRLASSISNGQYYSFDIT